MVYPAVDFGAALQDMWNDVITFIPTLVAAIVVFVIGWIVAAVLKRITNRVLEAVRFDRAVQRGALGGVLERTQYDASDIVAGLVFWAVLLLALQLAMSVFGPNPVSDAISAIVGYLPRVFVALLIVVLASFLAKFVRDLLSGVLARTPAGNAIATAAAGAVMVLAAFMALEQLRIAPSIIVGLWYALLAALVGAAIVAVGGGGIRTMQRYWERASSRVEETAPRYREQVREQATARERERAAAAEHERIAAERRAEAGAGPREPFGRPSPPPQPAG